MGRGISRSFLVTAELQELLARPRQWWQTVVETMLGSPDRRPEDPKSRELRGSTPLETLYRQRFSAEEREGKRKVWRVLCTHYFSRYVSADATVLDVGAGYCEFVNHIQAKRRIAVDANPDVKRFASAGVEAVCADATDLRFLTDNSVDVAFTSNFFEHMPNKSSLARLVREIHRVLRPEGRLLVMGPNIAYVGSKYWDYFDHSIPLTEKSVEELLCISGFRLEKSIARFLPYSFKSKLPAWPWLVRVYLRFGAITFPLFGKQFLVVAQKGSDPIPQAFEDR